MTIPDQAHAGRLDTLDGLRGLLACGVVLSHVAALYYVPWGKVEPTTTQHLFWNLGAPAVDIFFVMSGLVVTRSLLARPRPYLLYLASRVRRLLPMAIVGLLLGFGLRTVVQHFALPLDSSVLLDPLLTPLNAQDYLGILSAAFLPFHYHRLNPPMWSLSVEWQASLLLPMMLRMSRVHALVWPLVFAGLVLLGIALQAFMAPLFYVPVFFLGILLARVRPWEWSATQRWSPLLMLVGLVTVMARLWLGEAPILRFFCGAGAALLICGLLTSPSACRLLSRKVVQWLGKISYPLYLTHFPVLVTLVLVLNTQDFSMLAASCVSLPVLLLFAWGCERLIERPLQKKR